MLNRMDLDYTESGDLLWFRCAGAGVTEWLGPYEIDKVLDRSTTDDGKLIIRVSAKKDQGWILDLPLVEGDESTRLVLTEKWINAIN